MSCRKNSYDIKKLNSRFVFVEIFSYVRKINKFTFWMGNIIRDTSRI